MFPARLFAYDSLPLPLGPLRDSFGLKGHLTLTRNAVQKLAHVAPRWFIDMLNGRGLATKVELEDLTLANASGRLEAWSSAFTLFGFGVLVAELLMEVTPGSRDTEFVHFMRRKNEAEGQAYARATQRIIKAGAVAAEYLSWLIRKRKEEKQLASTWRDEAEGADKLTNLRYNLHHNGETFLKLLAAGLHTLQDSFSPAHTDRVRDAQITITKIHVWDQHNKLTHDHKDETWTDWRGAAATDASCAFLFAVLSAGHGPLPFQTFRATFRKLLFEPYLHYNSLKKP
jgi:hypothetical protein